MKDIISNIQHIIATNSNIKYVDEDWGQLDDYSPNFPVQWPCCLIDITGGQFSNIGMDRSAKPQNRQEGDLAITLRVANLRLTNTSALAPIRQKDHVRSLHPLIEEIHQLIHGTSPVENGGKLMRSAFRRIRRDDGVQEYQIMYTMGVHNV
ncbi:hypothetical protein [Sphingobacterium siyangense]|uniref:DUF3168 domain-containing protein n=1 Tax=Sphingobacterium siyangense TaxID=459529 RepID=A0A562MQH7_9SPHI|nr:hypothetical protein [Sphingobacterium siyangense]TWI22183.1 hypothetical protein IQ31_01588 [Sphingobacterium siyangense]